MIPRILDLVFYSWQTAARIAFIIHIVMKTKSNVEITPFNIPFLMFYHSNQTVNVNITEGKKRKKLLFEFTLTLFFAACSTSHLAPNLKDFRRTNLSILSVCFMMNSWIIKKIVIHQVLQLLLFCCFLVTELQNLRLVFRFPLVIITKETNFIEGTWNFLRAIRLPQLCSELKKSYH